MTVFRAGFAAALALALTVTAAPAQAPGPDAPAATDAAAEFGLEVALPEKPMVMVAQRGRIKVSAFMGNTQTSQDTVWRNQ